MNSEEGADPTPQGAPLEGEASGYLRLPTLWVSVGLLAVIVGLFALGIWANRNLRAAPSVGSVAAAVVPTAAVAAPVAATPVAATRVVVTPTPRATVALVVAATATAPPAPSATLPPTPLPTVEPTLAAEVGQAYQAYWNVRTQALLDLDKSHLRDAMDGDHLASTSQLIDELHSENRAIKTVVDHDFSVVQASADNAQVFDDYISNSFYVDPITLQPLTDPASDELKVLYQLKQLDGIWKVVDSVREQ